MKLLLVSIVCCGLLAGCATKSGIHPSGENVTAAIVLPDTLKASSSFKMLVRELAAERAANPDSRSFEPSEMLRNKYLMSLKNGAYHVRGFLRVNESFDAGRIAGLGGSTTEYTPEIRSFDIPVSRLQEMVRIPGIKSLELAQKVNFKKL